MLWGLYHGLLMVGARLRRRLLGPAPAWRHLLAPLRIVGTFVLVCVGWLMFRETELSMLVRNLTLSPATSTPLERDAGYALALRLLPYAAPLLAQSLYVEYWRSRGGDPPRPLLADALIVPTLCAAILVFRSRASLDFIYFQF